MFYVKQIRTLKLLRENIQICLGSKLYYKQKKDITEQLFANLLLTTTITFLVKFRVKFEYNGGMHLGTFDISFILVKSLTIE